MINHINDCFGWPFLIPFKINQSISLSYWEHFFFGFFLSSQTDSAVGIAQLLSGFDEETVMTIVTDRRFSVSLLRDCLRPTGEAPFTWNTTHPPKLSSLFYAARLALLQGIKTLISGVGENGVDEWTWLMLASTWVEFSERVNQADGELPDDAMEDVFQFIVMGFQVPLTKVCSKWWTPWEIRFQSHKNLIEWKIFKENSKLIENLIPRRQTHCRIHILLETSEKYLETLVVRTYSQPESLKILFVICQDQQHHSSQFLFLPASSRLIALLFEIHPTKRINQSINRSINRSNDYILERRVFLCTVFERLAQ